MNKNNFNYVSPAATVREIQAEGVLCMSFGAMQVLSGESQFETWTEEELKW